MKKIFLLTACLFISASVQAQTVQVLRNGCGTGAPSSGSNSLYVDSSGNLCSNAAGQVTLTPYAGLTHTVTTGGTAVVVFGANTIFTKGIITNPFNATESLFVDMVNSAQVAQNGGTNGTTYELQAGQTFLVPPTSVQVTVNAATSGHAFSATRY